MEKEVLRRSEARVLLWLDAVHPTERYLMQMSIKLDIEYGYLNKVVRGLINKGYITRVFSLVRNKKFFEVTTEGKYKLELAKRVCAEDEKTEDENDGRTEKPGEGVL